MTKALTTNQTQPVVTVDKQRNTLGPVAGQDPKPGRPLLQIHGLPPGPSPEERTAAILAKVQKARATQDKAKTEPKKGVKGV